MYSLHLVNASTKRRRSAASDACREGGGHTAGPSRSPVALLLLRDEAEPADICDDPARPGAPRAGFSAGLGEPGSRRAAHVARDKGKGKATRGPWPCFTADELERFPALRRRNFYCIQRHQATALHYDLRLQVDGGLVSWAIPKGLLGLTADEPQHQAVETTVHPIVYAVHEGSDGRVHRPSGTRFGTLLWDIGTYRISAYKTDSDDEDSQRRRRRRWLDDDDGDDGSHEETKLRDALAHRKIHLTLSGGQKMKDHSYRLVHTWTGYSTTGKEKKTWMLRAAGSAAAYTWGRGEETEYGQSVKSGRTFHEVCAGEVVDCRAQWHPV